MNRFLILVFFLIVTTGILYSQMISPLHQVMSSNVMINRPQVFRDMQEYVEKEYKDVKPGVRLDYFYTKAKVMRDALLYFIEAPEIVPPEFSEFGTLSQEIIDTANGKAATEILKSRNCRFDKRQLKFFIERGISANELKQIREKITPTDIEAFESLYKQGRIISIRYRGGVFTKIDLNLLASPAGVLDGIQDIVGNELGRLITKLAVNEQHKAILASLLIALKNAGLLQETNIGNNRADYAVSVGRYIAFVLVEQVREKIQREYPALLSYNDESIDSLITRVPDINIIFREFSANIKNEIEKIFDEAEHKTAQAVDEFAQQHFSGNTGFAVSEGEGAFTGGVVYSFVSGNLKLGAYFNGQFNKSINNAKSDSSLASSQSLLGVQVAFASDALQMDVLISKIVGPNKTSEFEGGLGMSYRVNDNMIVGLAGFSQIREQNDIYVVGLTFKAVSSGSPAILLGTNLQEGKEAMPIFQISFPISSH